MSTLKLWLFALFALVLIGCIPPPPSTTPTTNPYPGPNDAVTMEPDFGRATATPRLTHTPVPTRTPIPTRTSTATPSPTSTPLVQMTILVPDHGGRVDWSPQNMIAFSKYADDNKFGGEIYTMQSDGSEQLCLTCVLPQVSHLSNDQPAWSPDGKYIMFQSVDQALYNGLPYPTPQKNAMVQGGAGLDNNLWLITPDGANLYQLTTVAQGEASLHPHFSPDGKTLYWSARTRDRFTGSWGLKLADFVDDASGPHLANIRILQPLGATVFYESHNVWPDNGSGLFSTDANPTADLKPPCTCAMNIGRLDFTSGISVLLTNTSNVWQEHAQISPDGSHIVWVSSQGYPFVPSNQWQQTLATDLWQMNPDGSNQHQITWFNTPGHPEYHGGRTIVSDGSWSPDNVHYVVQMDVAVFPAAVSQVVVLTMGVP